MTKQAVGFVEYNENVLSHLESIGYPALILGADEMATARLMASAIHLCYVESLSAKKAARRVYNLTASLISTLTVQ